LQSPILSTRATLRESPGVPPDPKGPGNPLNLVRAGDCNYSLRTRNSQ